MRVFIKVCGNTTSENIEQVAALQPAYLGFIFYPKSKRYVTKPENTQQPINCKAKRVGVFVNATEEEIRANIKAYNLDIIQLHGDEMPAFCAKINQIKPVFKAFQINNSFDFGILKSYESTCYSFLFDSPSAGYGGSGKSFNWQLLQDYKLNTPFILSGGLGEDNLEMIKKIDHPKMIGIDLNSKFETEPGIKDIDKLSNFLKELNK